jgi:hypothetical protein
VAEASHDAAFQRVRTGTAFLRERNRRCVSGSPDFAKHLQIERFGGRALEGYGVRLQKRMKAHHSEAN